MPTNMKTAPTPLDAEYGDRQPLLSIRDLHTWFEIRKWGFLRVGEVRALDGVDFDLYPGEAISFVGESGCGKSTLAKTILGLHRPTKGEIWFNGEEMTGLNGQKLKAYRSQVGYVQQDPYGALPPFMTVRKILEEPLIINGVNAAARREERIRQVLEEVKLAPVEDILPKFPHQLSGGQQQRLVIARAMVLEPKLLVADEPVSMLDASVRVEILQLLRSLQEAHDLAIIYITHDLSTVRYFSERIFVMYAAKIIEKSGTRSLLDNPNHPYTQALLEATSDPDATNLETFKEVPTGEPPSMLNPPSGCRFHPRCPVAIEGKCEVTLPPEFNLGSTQKTACWLYEDQAV